MHASSFTRSLRLSTDTIHGLMFIACGSILDRAAPCIGATTLASSSSTIRTSSKDCHVMSKNQPVGAPPTSCATFLVFSLSSESSAVSTARTAAASMGDLVKNVGFRDPTAMLTCTVGIGSNVWNEITRKARPLELHPFPEVRGAAHTAISTASDLFFHIRSMRRLLL